MSWWRGRPLLTRLVASCIAVLTVVLAVIAVVSTVTIRAYLVDQLDQRVQEAVRQVRFGVVGGPGAPVPPGAGEEFLAAPGMDPRALGVLVRDTGNTRALAAGVLDGGTPPRARPLTDAQLETVLRTPADGTPRTVDVPGLGEYRLVRVAAPVGRETLVTGVPMTHLKDTVRQVVVVEVVVASAGLLSAAFALVVVVTLALRPLRRVADTATRVAGQNLHRGEVGRLERVPAADTDPRTEVGQVGVALNRLLDHVSAALVARQASETRVRRFVADASHELRTPLASIRGYAELTRRSHERLPPDAAHALRRVEAESDRMTSLVEDLLLLARLDSGRPLELVDTDVSTLVVDAVSDARAAGPDHRWRLRLPDQPMRAPVDPHRLHQVLVNLLGNARSHTPPGTVVTASVHREADAVVVRVRDNGPGVPAQLLPDVFGRFTRGDTSRARGAGSTGLGLAIVRAVVEAHSGTVRVTSVPGRTVFTVRLPARGAGNGGAEGRAEEAGTAQESAVPRAGGVGGNSQPPHRSATPAAQPARRGSGP